jgi:GNAT superfamily N-acetyltransferase
LEALPFVRPVHADSEVLDWARNVLLKRGETVVARRSGTILGFAALIGNALDQLYVLPGHYRCGIGRMLLDWAKTRSPNRLGLYTFQRNERARGFYESQGFRVINVSDGARNEEKEPDIFYEWNPAR